MKRPRIRPLALSLCLLLLGAQGIQQVGTVRASASTPVQMADVNGRGWKAIAACLGCVAAGATLVATGTWVTAIWIPGSALALAGCGAACYSAVFN